MYVKSIQRKLTLSNSCVFTALSQMFLSLRSPISLKKVLLVFFLPINVGRDHAVAHLTLISSKRT